MKNFTAAVSGEQPSPSLVDDGWTQTMWTDTQVPGSTPDENDELERIDFAVMEGLRARIDDIVDDPATAETEALVRQTL